MHLWEKCEQDCYESVRVDGFDVDVDNAAVRRSYKTGMSEVGKERGQSVSTSMPPWANRPGLGVQ